MAYLVHEHRRMLNACRLALIAVAASACSDLPCDTRFMQEIDWSEAPPEVGFSGDDFEVAFAPKWRAEPSGVASHNSYIPSLQTMNQDWVWSWRPDRSEPVVHHELKTRLVNYCNIVRWEPVPHTLVLPVHLEGWSSDGTWAYAGRSTLVTWALPSDQNPLPAYWQPRFGHRPIDNVMLTRAPEAFEEEAADFFELPRLPAMVVKGGQRLWGYAFYLKAVDPHLGRFSDLPDLGNAGGSPTMTLAEPIP